MPILGLGSNIGDRLSHLIAAIQKLAASRDFCPTSVSPVYESEAFLLPGSPPDWNLPFYNLALAGRTPLAPRELLELLKAVEREVGRRDRGRWAPREIDIDILAWSSHTVAEPDLHIPHQGLLERPFALLPLLDVAPHFHHPGLPAHWHPAFVSFPRPDDAKRAGSDVQNELSAALKPIGVVPSVREAPAPKLVAVINCTPDSFSDGGRFANEQEVIKAIAESGRYGASLVDIGAESTRPNAVRLSAEEEWLRLEAVFRGLTKANDKGVIIPPISIDTRHADVARRALTFGVSCINDVTGFGSEEMRRLAAESEVDLVVMHHLSVPADPKVVLPEDVDPVREVLRWAECRIEELCRAGISEERIIFDPGIGFGKTASQSWEIIKRIEEFHALNVRILVGHSRKSFLGMITTRPAPERDLETIGVSLYLAQKGVQYLRVHEIEMHQRVLTGYLTASFMEGRATSRPRSYNCP